MPIEKTTYREKSCWQKDKNHNRIVCIKSVSRSLRAYIEQQKGGFEQRSCDIFTYFKKRVCLNNGGPNLLSVQKRLLFQLDSAIEDVGLFRQTNTSLWRELACSNMIGAEDSASAIFLATPVRRVISKADL